MAYKDIASCLKDCKSILPEAFQLFGPKGKFLGDKYRLLPPMLAAWPLRGHTALKSILLEIGIFDLLMHKLKSKRKNIFHPK